MTDEISALDLPFQHTDEYRKSAWFQLIVEFLDHRAGAFLRSCENQVK